MLEEEEMDEGAGIAMLLYVTCCPASSWRGGGGSGSPEFSRTSPDRMAIADITIAIMNAILSPIMRYHNAISLIVACINP